uniref:Transposon protein, putative, unclassified n=2 Tax=Oryza sativa subsp. japonica TaxID=39947 RepID=Q2R7D9_ORYSJ|nr:transposon protein, putative, unclassified [Oryza sativa Japonica Group]ABA92576.1 transposon protein, putative, unclassified [Oryza sativa Japonica Group]
MSWHRAGVLLLGAQSCLPVPGVPAVGGIGSVLLSMARMGWKLCHVFRLYTVVVEMNLTQAEEEPTLLMAQVMGMLLAGEATSDRTTQQVHLTEKKVVMDHDGDGEGAGDWFLDTGATNHMTGVRSAFADLDTSVMGTVKFGDGSVIEIRGRGCTALTFVSNKHS